MEYREAVSRVNGAEEAESVEPKGGVLTRIRKRFSLSRIRATGMLMALMAAMMSVGAFADEATGIAAVTGATSTVTSLVGTVFDLITGNGVLVVFMAFGLLGAAISIFRRLKRAAR